MEYVLDGSQMRTREEAHTHIAQRLRFPDYYGRNLDALYDCLMDIPDAQIIIPFSDAMDGAIRKVLLDAAAHSSNITVFLA
ncbi:MAG: barstar family protein [Oscillospiraceae bacterium]|nr:barstar family protein [Oscillospiraceae bacterium]